MRPTPAYCELQSTVPSTTWLSGQLSSPASHATTLGPCRCRHEMGIRPAISVDREPSVPRLSGRQADNRVDRDVDWTEVCVELLGRNEARPLGDRFRVVRGRASTRRSAEKSLARTCVRFRLDGNGRRRPRRWETVRLQPAVRRGGSRPAIPRTLLWKTATVRRNGGGSSAR
jgi:hypothetical protein